MRLVLAFSCSTSIVIVTYDDGEDYGDDDDDDDDGDDDDDYLGPAFDILQFTKSTNISQSQIIIFCMEGMEACFSLGQPSLL